ASRNERPHRDERRRQCESMQPLHESFLSHSVVKDRRQENGGQKPAAHFRLSSWRAIQTLAGEDVPGVVSSFPPLGRPMETVVQPIVRFADFEVDTRSGELRKSGRKIRLPEQSFQILELLLDRAGEVVTREELHQRLWP